MDIVWLAGGLILLVLGGDLLVRGAVALAERMGVSPLVIGLTLVGFGTSTPELVTSVQASLAGAPGIAIGNIVGSNIANILLILGASALLSPMVVHARALKRDGGVMVAVAIGFLVLAAFLPFGRLTGAVLVALLCLYLVVAFRSESGAAGAKALAAEGVDPGVAPGRGAAPWLSIVMAIGGLALVIVGGRLLVDGAVGIARGFAISETVIGLTIVAVGTSMPELVTSVVAALRKQADVAFGNVVGSNIYNILGIGGATALIAPVEVPETIIAFDAPVMVAVSLVLVVFAFTGLRIGRREGAVLLIAYATYLFWLWPK